ncbi:MAG: ABC transporter substrate-binding protein [Gammaproteobacteria bacterium]|nr:MAG: ABC transporter substrate-binding protein [Gammaproteobacteria bacterium]
MRALAWCALILVLLGVAVGARADAVAPVDEAAPYPASSAIRITTFDYASPVIDGLAQALSDVYASLGVEMTVDRLPGKRALFEAADGVSDGELMRIALPVSEYLDLIRIPVPLTEVRVRAFGFDPALKNVDSWADLAPYRVGSLRGIVLVEQNLGDRAIYTNRFASLAGMLMFGRLDAVVVPDVALKNGMETLKLTDIEFVGSGELGRFHLYHYLHRRHAGLARKLTARLSEELADGRWAARLAPFGLDVAEEWEAAYEGDTLSARERLPEPTM